MSDVDLFDIHDYGVREGLFHCTREPHEVLGHCHDYRCDVLRQEWSTARARIATLEARIAELTREREASERGWRERCDQLAQHRDALQKRLGVGFLGDDGRDAASIAAAARAERDEAVGLLDWQAHHGHRPFGSEDMWRPCSCAKCQETRALLARLAAAPEKPPGPYSGT
jgi:hypothetical protein